MTVAKITEVLDQKLGNEKATEFLRKANVLMARHDAEESKIKKTEYGQKLMNLYTEYELTDEEQKQYQKEISGIMIDNMKLWELTR